MGNALWTGVRLRDLLDAAGIRAGAIDVSFDGLDEPPLASIPDVVKSLAIDRAREADVMVAYEMNGEPLPMLNGFPLRLVVPGWYATYWIKCA
jgi:DMSO/TMAO reductase YedYZ molybdopterin-dependent catalytic subunit